MPRPPADPPADLRIHTARGAEDWRAVRALCCETGDAGRPVDASRWPFFAELWIGPYQRLVPDWTLVAESAGRVVGYLTGCPDTLAFRRAAVLAVTLPLLVAVARGRYRWTSDTRRFVRRTFGFTPGPEARLRAGLPPSFERVHPAHLHMNVAVGYRELGIGRGLVERYLAALSEAGVPGVHLFCGAAARGFYQRTGFETLGSLEIRPGVWVYALGRHLSSGMVGMGGMGGGGSGEGPGA